MPSLTIYVMRYSLLRRMEKRLGEELRCRLCGKPIQPGDEVVSAPCGGGRKNFYIYHKECFEQTLH